MRRFLFEPPSGVGERSLAERMPVIVETEDGLNGLARAIELGRCQYRGWEMGEVHPIDPTITHVVKKGPAGLVEIEPGLWTTR